MRNVIVWQVYVLCLLWGLAYVSMADLRKDEFWKTIGTLLVSTGFVNMIVAAFFAANLGDRNTQPPRVPQDPEPVEPTR